MKRIKKDIIQSLTCIGLPETDAKKIFKLFVNNIISGLKNKNEIHIVNFGKFTVVKKKKKSFINPKTKKPCRIKGENKIRFFPSKNLIRYINNEQNQPG